jgi:hypothetical protein
VRGTIKLVEFAHHLHAVDQGDACSQRSGNVDELALLRFASGRRMKTLLHQERPAIKGFQTTSYPKTGMWHSEC